MAYPLLPEYKEGKITLVDKPFGWTSFDAVNKIKHALNIKRPKEGGRIKVGHAGSLDPLATGLLVIATGKKTKELTQLQAEEKTYQGTIKLGAITPSLDLETEESETAPIQHITPELIQKTLEEFIGEIKQEPPIFSAVQVDGKRLYEHARKGEEVEIKTRAVSITTLKATSLDMPYIHFLATVSKGTYIRSLARDIGHAMGTLGYLTALRRTKAGSFSVEHARHPEDIAREIRSLRGLP